MLNPNFWRNLLFPYVPLLCWFIPIIGSGLTLLFALAHRKLRDYAPATFVMATFARALNCIAVFGFLAMAIFMKIYSCGLPCNVHFLDVDKGLPVGVGVIA